MHNSTAEVHMNTFAINKKAALAKALIAVTGIACAVALPQLFHMIGIASGTGAALGSALLPMQLPVLIAGILGGPAAGVTAGIISPLVSFALSEMPSAAVLPFMVIELGVYGLTAGLLARTKLNSFAGLLITQLAGRAARALAIVAAIYVFGNVQLTLAAIPEFITAGIFGILVQWAAVPYLSERLERVKKLYE